MTFKHIRPGDRVIYELQLFNKTTGMYEPRESGQYEVMRVTFLLTRHPSKRLVLQSKCRRLTLPPLRKPARKRK